MRLNIESNQNMTFGNVIEFSIQSYCYILRKALQYTAAVILAVTLNDVILQIDVNSPFHRLVIAEVPGFSASFSACFIITMQ